MQSFFSFTPATASAAAAPGEDELVSVQGGASEEDEGDADAEAEQAAVTELEAGLDAAFERMSQIEQEAAAPAVGPSPAKLQLKQGIGKVVAQQQIVKRGFYGEKHFEQEGSDAMLFSDVPSWIKFEKISGYRYRLVTLLADAADEFELYNEGVAFYGSPGASGWADKIGDVAIHYLSSKWAVFSKIYPFPEQSIARETHEDVLLLGSTRHVMLTPCCAYAISEGGLADRSTRLSCLGGEGGLLKRSYTVDSVPTEVLRRLYLTWGHDKSDYAVETTRFQFDLQTVLEAKDGAADKAKRWLGSLAQRVSGHKVVHEHWMRYPALPLEPGYYAQLLATATSATEDEQRTRAIMEPQPTPRAGGTTGESVAVAIGDLNA